MKKNKNIFVVMVLLLAAVISVTAGVSNAKFNETMVSAEESIDENLPPEDFNFSINSATSNDSIFGDDSFTPTEEKMKIIVECGDYYNIHYTLINDYLFSGRRGLKYFVSRTHRTFYQLVVNGMCNRSSGTKNPEYNNQMIANLITSAVEIGRKDIYRELARYGVIATSQIVLDSILKGLYALAYLPTFLISLNRAIVKVQESPDCPETLRDFQTYEVDFNYGVEQETSVPQTPFYWIIIAGVGGVGVTILAVVLINLKKKKKVAVIEKEN